MERRTQLKEYSTRWRSLNFPICTTLPEQNLYNLAIQTTSDGYVLAQVFYPNTIQLTRFPSHTRGVPYKSWSISGETLGTRMSVCAVDSSQNLLAVGESTAGVTG